MLRFRVRYSRPADLAADYDQQLTLGGLVVRVEPPAGLRLFDQAALELVTWDSSLELAAQVVQVFPGVGVALSLEIAVDSPLHAMVETGRALEDLAASPPEHELVVADAAADAPTAPRSETAAKIQLALYGNKEERMRIMREGDRSVHRYVLRNPGLGVDEVAFIAKMTAIAPDLLKAIGERRDWAQRPEIALALVCNPKTPVPLAIQTLRHVAPSELRRLAKTGSLRMPILQAARKLVIG